MNGLRRNAGLTLLELLITVTLIMLMVGFASFNYVKIVEEQKIGKAANECREFVKALKTWENKKGVPVRQFVAASGQPTMICPNPACKRLVDTNLTCKFCKSTLPVRPFLLDDLIAEQIVKTLPDDPWSTGYMLDTTRGIIYSCGPNSKPYIWPGSAQYDPNDRDNADDDIRVPFRPPFEMERATQDLMANQVVVQFSRAVDRGTISTQTLTLVTSNQPLDITTMSLDLNDPYRVKVYLKTKYPKSDIRVTAGAAIKARDGTNIDLSKISVVSTTGQSVTT